MNDTDLIARIAKTDAYAPHLPLPDRWSSAVAFAQIDRRMDMLTEERLTETTPARPPRKGLVVAVAAFVVVILGGLVVGLLAGGTDEATPADTPTTIPPVTTTSTPATTAATATNSDEEVLHEAQTLMEDFVAGFNSYATDDWLSLWAEPQYTFTIHDTTGTFDEPALRERIRWGQLFHDHLVGCVHGSSQCRRHMADLEFRPNRGTDSRCWADHDRSVGICICNDRIPRVGR